MRPSKRAPDEMRPVSFERGVARYAEGSCLVKFGNTHVLCAASLEDKPPPWLRGQGRGWVTAEYAMLPRATHTRTRRESSSGKPSGRTQEIQRLIGRSLRAVTQSAGARRAPDRRRLRRDPGRRRHAHRGDHRRLARAARLLPMDALALHHQGQSAARSCRRRLLRRLQRRAGASISITPRIRPPRPTPISSSPAPAASSRCRRRRKSRCSPRPISAPCWRWRARASASSIAAAEGGARRERAGSRGVSSSRRIIPASCGSCAICCEPHGVDAVSAGDLGVAEPEETETTFAGNALLKARAAGDGDRSAGLRR